MHTIYVAAPQDAKPFFCEVMETREDVESFHYFATGEAALAFVRDNLVECAFLEVSADGRGLDLAATLRCACPDLEFSFLTDYDDYARAAYRMGGRGYLSSKFTMAELNDAITVMRKLHLSKITHTHPVPTPKPGVVIRTFGNFDLLLNGNAVPFQNSKAKEALAFLVHQCGGTVNGAQLFLALWENAEYTASTSTYVRRTITALAKELEALELGNLLVRSRNCYSVDLSILNCDRNALHNGSRDAAAHFAGQYMNQYLWAQPAIPAIARTAEMLRDV